MLKSSSVTGNFLFLAMSGKIIYNIDYMITIYSNSHNHSRTGIDPQGNVLIFLTILKFVLSSSTDNGFDQFPARSESIGLSPRSLCCQYWLDLFSNWWWWRQDHDDETKLAHHTSLTALPLCPKIPGNRSGSGQRRQIERVRRLFCTCYFDLWGFELSICINLCLSYRELCM